MAQTVGDDHIDDLVGRAVEEYLEQLDRGEQVQIDEFAQRYPQISDLLMTVIPAFERTDAALHACTGTVSTSRRHQQLGDFRILRQIGRGGMGVVYEAEQISMHRRVALKVLPLAGLVDEAKIRRFQNEVRAVAALDHPNIVSVYMVGEERGVHYYAMHLIRGRSLSEVIASLRYCHDGGEELNGASMSQITRIGGSDDAHVEKDEQDLNAATEDAAGFRLALNKGPCETVAETESSTIPHSSRREYFRSVVALGIQAASALQHAHDEGILHRDIKPANLLLDGSAKLYLTDFGLARIEADVGVTMTGDLVGTLRYMAPEQALAKRVVVDHRADIYSLGVTLYELLALRPAYCAEDRQQLLKQIAFEEPTPLRHVDREIPVELETIIHKAMSKDMEQRYASAQEFADDLRAHLDNRPIKAKPPSVSEIIGKWTRRNPAWTWAAIITLALITVTLAASTFLVSKQRNIAQAALNEAASRASDLARRNYMIHVANADRALLDHDNYLRARFELDLCSDEHKGWEWHYLDGRVRAILPQEFPGAEQPIFTRDGERLIAIGGYGTPEQRQASIWDLSSGTLVKSLAHEAYISHIALSPDDSQIAAGDHNGNLFVWDIETGEKVWSVKTHDAKCDGLAYSPDGSRIAAACYDQTVKVLDATTGQMQFTLPVGGFPRKVMFSPDGRWLATGLIGGERSAMLIDVAAGEIRVTFPGEVHRLPTFAPSGRLIATSNRTDGAITIWDWDGTRLVSLRTWPAPDVWALDFSADGDQLVSGSDRVKVWDVATGLELASLDTQGQQALWLASSPRDALVAFFDIHRGIRVWRYGEYPDILTVKPLDATAAVTFSPSGHLVAASPAPSFATWWAGVTVQPGRISVLDAVTGSCVLSLGGELHSASWTSDGRHLVAAADAKPGVRIHSSSTGKITRTFTGNAPVAFARISPSGKHLISVFRDGTVRVWDLQSGEKAREFSVPVMNKGTMLAVAMSPDNAYVAVALGRQDKWSSALEIWDIGSQSLVSSLAGGRNVRTMTFSKDGRSLYVGNAVDRDGNSLSVFDIETGRQLKSFIGEMGRTVRSIVLSPDENQIVSGDSSGRVIVWDVATQQPLITLTDDGGPIVTSVDWSSDGQRIAAGRGDGTIQIWTLPRSP